MGRKSVDGYAKAVNITIPTKLWEQMEPYRDRLNVSAICQRAIRKEITLIREFEEWKHSRK